MRNKQPKPGVGSGPHGLALSPLLGEEDAAVMMLEHFDKRHPDLGLLK